MKSIGIVGATGYVGAELIRLLLNHNKVKLTSISSVSYKGEDIANVYNNLKKSISLNLTSESEVVKNSEIIFICLPTGLSEDIAEKCINDNKICIDLGADFRLDKEEDYREWYGEGFKKPHLHSLSCYGLPELYRDKIKSSNIIANPGCFPTSVNLGLMPALKEKLISSQNIIIDSKSGITGSGRALSLASHFAEVSGNFSPYKVAQHRHIPEIEQILSDIAKENIIITFVPHILPINRGILSTIYSSLNVEMTIKEIHEIYREYYKNEKFIRVLDIGNIANIKNVKYSNYCDISLHKDSRTNKLIIVSAIDNMVKGSAGQAIQNMNIVLGLSEEDGLEYIPPAF